MCWECSNTIALISHASKVILKILQDRFQQYVNCELPDVQAGRQKMQRNHRLNCQHLLDHRKNKRVPEKHLLKWKWRVKKLAYNSAFRKLLRSWYPVPSLHGKYMEKQWKQWQTIFLGSQITADDRCSHEIKGCLLLGSKAMNNLDTILKGRDITLPTKVHLVKAMVFPAVMYVCMWELDYKES